MSFAPKDDEKYQSLIKLYDLNESLQNQTELSLNQSKREKTFTQFENDRKEYELLIGLRDTDSEDSDEATSDDSQTEDSDDIENDILLIEAAQISADLNSYWNRAKQRMVVQQ